MTVSNCELVRTAKVRKAMRESAAYLLDDLQRTIDRKPVMEKLGDYVKIPPSFDLFLGL